MDIYQGFYNNGDIDDIITHVDRLIERYKDSYNFENVIDSITNRLYKLTEWQAVAFAAICAERVAPICCRFGRERSWTLFESGLRLVWVAIAEEKDKEDIVTLQRALDVSPDAHVEDTYFPEHYAMRVICILTAALDTIISDNRQESIKSLSYQMFSLTDEFDFIVNDWVAANKTVNEHPQSLLEVREFVIQQELSELLASLQQPLPELLHHLRCQAQRLAKHFEVVLPLIAKTCNTLRQQEGKIPETYETLLARIEGLAKWQAVAFSAACIERISPVFLHIATQQSCALFESCLNLLWSACQDDKSDQEITAIRTALEAIPEASIVYAERSTLELYPRDILSLVADALDVLESPGETTPASFVCSGMFEWMYWFDFYWNESPKTKRMQRASFMADETIAQHEVLQMLDSYRGEPSSEVIHRLRDQARQWAKTLDTRLPELFKIIEAERY